jgi:hypothetical protein
VIGFEMEQSWLPDSGLRRQKPAPAGRPMNDFTSLLEEKGLSSLSENVQPHVEASEHWHVSIS